MKLMQQHKTENEELPEETWTPKGNEEL